MSAMNTLEAAVSPGMPQWTAKLYAAKVGRDHLGLGSVSSDQILPSLTPGINVLTIHPRYHSFYAFLLEEYWLAYLPRSRDTWKAFFRPRDFYYSLGAHLCDQPEHGNLSNIVGGRKISPLAAERRASYSATSDYIDSDFGGYGLYYRSVMIELGLVLPGGAGFPCPVDVPTEEGSALAKAFRSAVQETAYYQRYFAEDNPDVPLDVVVEFIRAACLCQLKTAAAPDRRLVQAEFLHGGDPTGASSRRQTFQLLLDIAHQTGGSPVQADTFRQLLYFGASAEGCRYAPSAQVSEIHRRWRLYQAREYYAFALNVLWRHLYDWGLNEDGDLRPLPLERLWADIGDALNFRLLAQALHCSPPNLTAQSDVLDLLRWLYETVGSSEATFDDLCGIDAPVHEHRLYNLAIQQRGNDTAEVAGMITLLALIHARFGRFELSQQPEWQIARMGADGRLSVDGFVRELRRRLRAGPLTLLEFTRWIYNDYVILQHQLVASSKLPDNTFRFQRDGSRLRFFNLGAQADFLDSRFDALATTIHELGFCGRLAEPDHLLTDDGLQLLLTGDLP